MPASSEARGRWRRRRRDPPPGRRSRLREPENDDTLEENEDDDDHDLDPPQNNVENDDGPQSNGQDVGNLTSREKETEKLGDGVVRLCEFPTAVKRVIIRPHSSVLAIAEAERSAQVGYGKGQNQSVVPLLENISYGQLQSLSVIPRDSFLSGASSEEASSSSGSYVIKPPSITPGHGVVKRLGSAGRVHVLPSHSDWFSLNSVHRLERQVVPHFFCGKSAENTPEKYMECRNFIVAKYVENPEIHLTVSDCEGLVSGIEIDDLSRIVQFLDHWGIINYCASPLTSGVQNDEKKLFEDSNAELHVPVDALKSIDSLIRFNLPKCRLKAIDAYPEIANKKHEEDSDYSSTIGERLSENHCNHCCRSLDTVCYQSTKEVDVLLCVDCFHEGRFVAGHSSLDFVRANSIKDHGDGAGVNWSDQEIMLLLQGVQLFNDNWNKIAEHVGTKSKAQCILHFVRLPLDGLSLENIDISDNFGSSDAPHCDGIEENNPHSNGLSVKESGAKSDFPFENLENPVMGLVSFVASALGPRVAAACSQASLASLCKNYDKDVNPHENATITANAKGVKSEPLSSEKVTEAAYDGLAAAAVKAKLFADHEEREIQRLAANIVNQQLKRLELKLKQIAEIETLLMKECEQIERTRQRFTSQRTLMASSQYASPPMMSPRPTMNLQNFPNAMPTNRPFLTNYGSNQPIHPHLSLMNQPGMYGLSPRMPSSNTQPSSSSFSPQPNSQSSIGHPLLRSVSGTKSGLG